MDPIVIEFEVRGTVEHAFSMWAEHAALWWPRSHSISQAEGFDVVFEPFSGGRIYERGVDGAEHEWGEVLRWELPRKLDYTWHIFTDEHKPTRVAVTFDPAAAGAAVRVVNSDLDALGDVDAEKLAALDEVWRDVCQHFRDAV